MTGFASLPMQLLLEKPRNSFKGYQTTCLLRNNEVSKLVMKRTEELVKCCLFAGKSLYFIFNCASIFFVLFTLLKYLFWLLLSKKNIVVKV